MDTQSIINELSEIKSIVLDLQSNNKDVLTFGEARKYLDCSASYLYKLTSTNQVPHYKPRGKQLYFNKIELQDWLLQNRNVTLKEIEQQAVNHVSFGKKGN